MEARLCENKTQDNLGKLASECQTILDFDGDGDDGGGDDDSRNSQSHAQLQSDRQHHKCKSECIFYGYSNLLQLLQLLLVAKVYCKKNLEEISTVNVDNDAHRFPADCALPLLQAICSR